MRRAGHAAEPRFRETTARGIEQVGGAKRAKASLELNTAEPPPMMRNNVHAVEDGEAADQEAIIASIEAMVARVQQYVPGYKLAPQPVFEGNTVSVQLEVTGAGDYLLVYAGNLDIMTAVALKVGEDLAAWLQSQPEHSEWQSRAAARC